MIFEQWVITLPHSFHYEKPLLLFQLLAIFEVNRSNLIVQLIKFVNFCIYFSGVRLLGIQC